ncbi:MAG: acyl-CoA thioesterase II [Polyangiaceae bacterium]|nr:acyl-CoA thioesterase II [Myxococcales bacterium]MCB9586888.1 acyl-CoA thioesterase II [Polyangiaceae bacterium]MCB9608176.1 acyl-CoA thioesterase II [Polyangiaceae bacterium]
MSDPHTAVQTLLQRLDLEEIDTNLYRGFSPIDGRPRVFGGQVAGQALVAACRTVEGRTAHSLHAYFLRPGDPAIPIIYEVDRIRDGKSFTTRRVVALQRGEAIFSMAVSFHVEEPGLEHQAPMPTADPPESVPSNSQRLEEGYQRTQSPLLEFLMKLERPIEQHDLDPVNILEPKPHRGLHRIWFRSRAKLPDDPLLHQCVLTYASDMSLLDNCINYHGITWFNPNLIAASLDHTIWFHRPFRADEWLLYAMDSPSAAGSRGLNLAHVYSQDGTLVASVAQESLMRLVDKKR